MVRTFTALILFGAVATVFSVPGWQMLPSQDVFELSAMRDAGKGIIHGITKSGQYHSSKDSGRTWTKIGSLHISNETPIHVDFPSQDTGFAGSKLSTVWRTVDGGKNWTRVFLDFLTPWKRFEFFNSKVGLALNRDFLVRTMDAWVTPEIVRRDVDELQILDDKRAFILAKDSIYASNDTGRTWSPLFGALAIEGRVSAFHFADVRNGFLILETTKTDSTIPLFTLYRTNDSGATWSKASQSLRQPNQIPSPPYAHILFRDSLHGLCWESAFDEDGLAHFMTYRTEDGGLTWIKSTPPVGSWGEKKFSLSPEGDIWILDLDGSLSRTRNSGLDWEKMGGGGTRFYESVYFRDRSQGFALAKGTLFETRNGGRTWRPQPKLEGVNVWGLQFADTIHGFAVGDSGRVLKSIDGGELWTTIAKLPISYFHSLTFCDSTTGLVEFENNAYLTTDAGKTWRVIGEPANLRSSIRLFTLSDARHFYVTDFDDGVFSSADGGGTWSLPAQGTNLGSVSAFAFPTTGIHYALSSDGGFLASQDRGLTWEVRSYVPGPPWPPTPRSLFTSFLSEFTGFVYGDSGLILSTVDGGQTWNDVSLPWSAQVNWLVYRAGLPIWAMTVDGNVWEYSTPTALNLSSSRGPSSSNSILVGNDRPNTRIHRKFMYQGGHRDAMGRNIRIEPH